MKKLFFCLGLLLTVCAVGAIGAITKGDKKVMRVPRTVQGIEYTPQAEPGVEIEYVDEPEALLTDNTFTMDMVQNWTGEGANQAVLVIQWNLDGETSAIAFGYRWDGQATGSDMVKAVAENNPRFYALMQYTNVSSPTDPNGGYTVCGLGWDTDDDGDIALIDTGNNNQVYTSENGFFRHPSTAYDYDNWTARDTDDFWRAGWYSKGFWSYWVKDSSSANWSFSNWGASGRVLQNGSWDGWNFSPGFSSKNWLPIVAAPASIPPGALTDFNINGLHYTLTNYQKKTVKLTTPAEGSTYAGEITVPATFAVADTTYNVVEIDKEAFKGSTVTTVSLPASVTKIGNNAFENSTLTTLNVPDVDALKIGTYAFAGCSGFGTLMIPSSMTEIPEGLYKGTAVAAFNPGANITAIGASAFEDCAGLEQLTVPTTIKSIGENAFAGCDALTSVKCESTYPLPIAANTFSNAAYASAILSFPTGFGAEYAAAEGWMNFQNTSEFNIAVNGGDLFRLNGVTYRVTSTAEGTPTVKATYCKVESAKPTASEIKAANKAGYTGAVVIPATVPYQGINFAVTELNDSIFYEASEMTSLDIQAPVTRLGSYALYDCEKLESLTLPSTITTIGNAALGYCEKLTSLQLPEGLTTLEGTRNFFHCEALTAINIPTGITAIPDQCFSYCKALTSLSFHDGITSFGSAVMQNCTSLTSVKLPTGMTEIYKQMFQSCSALETLSIPATVTKVGSAAFSGCSKLNIVLPEGVTEIGEEAFKSCLAMTEFTIPSGMTKIPLSLFNGCSNLTKVTMSDNVTEIGNQAFRDCPKLATIALVKDATEETPAAPAREAATGINLPSKLTKLGNYAFYGCKAITAVPFPEGLTSIGTYAFQKCSALTSVTLPEGLTKIEQSTFQDCSALESVYIPETVKSIGSNAFRDAKLSQIVFPAAVTSYNSWMVGGNSGIKVYISSTKPAYCGSTYWCSTNSSTYHALIVPTGTAETYSAKTYWNKSAISEPALQSLNLSDAALAKSRGNIVLTGRVSGNYDMTDLPEQFLAANNKQLFAGKTIKVRYRIDSTAEYSEADATVADDGTTFTATFPAISGSTYEVALATTYGETECTSSAASLEAAAGEPFYFKQAEYDAHFDESFTPELVFDTDEYTLSDVEFVSSNTDVASVNKRTGVVTVKRVAGDAVITAQLKTNTDIKTEITVHAALRTPVQDIVLGDGTKTINLTYLDILALTPTIVPENADIQSYDIAVSNTDIATTYSVRAFNPSRQYYELLTHQVGECDVTFTAQDGSGVSSTYHIVVADPDRTPLADNYQDGTFWLNEEWFGHTNGSVNYITKDKDIKYRVYESQNPYQSFGATSQYGIIYAGKLIVMSKQHDDGGDPRQGGGRVVVADAKTLKKLASFDYIGQDVRPSGAPDGQGDGDGRACVGVNENKVYLGTTQGIQILDLSTLTLGGFVTGIPEGKNAYSGQLGDMVAAGNYAFVIQQDTGVHVIDADTDAVVKTFPATATEGGETAVGKPQGITRSMDGNVWVASLDASNNGIFCCIDPETLEVTQQVQLPTGIKVTCGWGAWRSTNFQGAKNENAIWFGAGTPATVTSGNNGYYKWVIGTDISAIQPVYVFPKDLPGVDDKTFQAPYSTVRYDDRSNELLIAATHGASSAYRNTWLHFVNCETGEISKTIEMKKYYWFPSMPIFPDKYAPEFGEIESVDIRYIEGQTPEAKTIDLTDLVTDRDNIAADIRLSIISEESDIYEAALNGKTLTVTAKPGQFGMESITLKAESNGVVTTVDIPVNIELISGVDNAYTDNGIITVSGHTVRVLNMEGTDFVVYDMSGRAVSAFNANSNDARIRLTVPDGIYIICSADGKRKVKAAVY